MAAEVEGEEAEAATPNTASSAIYVVHRERDRERERGGHSRCSWLPEEGVQHWEAGAVTVLWQKWGLVAALSIIAK